MKKLISFAVLLLAMQPIKAQVFADLFQEKTLRVDYILSGNAQGQSVYLDELSSLPGWTGRRHRLAELPLAGNGQVSMTDCGSGKVIYRTSFSSLFMEWLATEEARNVSKAFEHTVLLPFPKQAVEVEIALFDSHRRLSATLKHRIDPQDILIHAKGLAHLAPYRYMHKGGDAAKCIDVAILAEGYTESEMDTFYQDAAIACESLFSHEPFKSMKDRFNIVAVASPSEDSGVSIPRLNDWKHTPFGSHYSTFYSDRYLTTTHVKAIHDVLAGIPYEHVIILANTDEYGGGGIYNAYTLTTAHHPNFRPVVVHEFGHSFGGLGDEYAYGEDDTYPLDTEPWEPNITTLVDFGAKWKDMLKGGTPQPTPADQAAAYPVGVYEGAGYKNKGIFRPAENCRMRTNEHPEFCPVCQKALRKLIEFYTE